MFAAAVESALSGMASQSFRLMACTEPQARPPPSPRPLQGAMEFAVWMFRHADPEQLAPAASTILGSLLALLDDRESCLSLRAAGPADTCLFLNAALNVVSLWRSMWEPGAALRTAQYNAPVPAQPSLHALWKKRATFELLPLQLMITCLQPPRPPATSPACPCEASPTRL